MRFRLLYVIALSIVCAITFSGFTSNINEEGGIAFYKGSWDHALELAKKENKIVFLDISASWCGPCKLLKKKTFPNADVGNYYNEHFINVAKDGEIGEGEILAKKYAVRGYPTLLFIDGDGNILARTSGYRNASKFLKLGRAVEDQYGQNRAVE